MFFEEIVNDLLLRMFFKICNNVLKNDSLTISINKLNTCLVCKEILMKNIYISSCTFQGFVLGDLVALVAHAKREAYRAVLKHW